MAVMGIIYAGLIVLGVDIPTPLKNQKQIDTLRLDFNTFIASSLKEREQNVRFQVTILAVTCTRLTNAQADLIPECRDYRRSR